MLKKITLGTAAAITAMTAMPAAVEAHPRGRAHYHGNYDDRYDRRAYTARRCRSGTTGAIIGGAAGALLGREVAGRRDRTLGTILGGAAGALGGRALTRDKHCR